MSVGIELIMHDGSKDWIDPVEENIFDSMVNDATDTYEISNTYRTYSYKVSDVKELVKYPLYECCGFDARGDHYIRCENWKLDD